MTERRAVITSPVGLHARPAALFVQSVAEAGIPVQIRTEDGRTANAGSILGVLTLNVTAGAEVVLSSEHPEAGPILDGLVALLSQDLDETAAPQ